MQKIIPRKYIIGIPVLVLSFLACSVFIIRIYHTEPQAKDGNAIIRRAIGRGLNKDPNHLIEEDFKQITEIFIEFYEPFDLSLLEKCTNLQNLSLGYGFIATNPKPRPVSSKWKLFLGKLHIIDLENIGSTDLKPIEKLTNLKELHLYGLIIYNIDPLAKLKNLEVLEILRTRVSNIKAVKNLKNLRNLEIRDSKISNLAPLKRNTNLKKLDLSLNPISKLNPIKGLINLQSLNISSSNVSNIEPLRGLLNLQSLNISYTNVSDIEPLKNLKNLRVLNIGQCKKITKEQIQDLKRTLPNTKL